MKYRLLGLLAATALTTAGLSAASAADLPLAPPPAPIVMAPIFTWTGFYAGVNAGWGWRDSNEQTVILGGAVPGTLLFPGNGDGGFVGGGQIGYNWQFGSFVVGAETDIQWVNSGNSEAVAFVPFGARGAFVPGTFRNDLSDWFGTLRLRAGFAFDRVLVYATGGLAYTEDNTGWAVGGGFEWALPTGGWFGGIGNAATFGIEGLWVSVDNENDFNFNTTPIGTFRPAGGPTVNVFAPAIGNNDSEFFIARAKLNFKFGTY